MAKMYEPILDVYHAFLLPGFDHLYGDTHQSLDRDQLAYCDLAREHQQRVYELLREQHTLTIASIKSHNSTRSTAPNI